MIKFEKKLLHASLAVISAKKNSADYDLTLYLSPFIYNGEIVDSTISFEGLKLPSQYLQDLIGLKWVFDEEESMSFNSCFTIKGVHNPVDLKQVEFIESRDGFLKVIAKIIINFEFERYEDFENLELIMNATVASTIL